MLEKAAEPANISGCRYKTGFFGGKFLPPHKGHIDCILRCASECEKLYVVLMHHGCQENEIIANYRGKFPKRFLEPSLRKAALKAQLGFLENVEVISYDCREADQRALAEGLHEWAYECVDMVSLMGHFDVAYSSEPEYAENFKHFYPWAEAVLVDVDRNRNPISATDIRNMTFAEAYPHLPREYQCLINMKVLVTGTESCGKSMLVKKLAAALNTSYTEEQGRLVCEHYKMSSPPKELYPSFLFAQKEAERHALRNANMVAICDTDAIVTEFYYELYENDSMDMAFELARNEKWDKVLFVEPTVPWVDDGYRTSPDIVERCKQAERLKKMYADVGYDLCVLDGDYKSNYEQALAEIEDLLGCKEAI